MPSAERAARLYLVTPEGRAPEALAPVAAALLDTGAVACLRIALGAAAGEDDWTRMANHLIGPAHAAEVPLLVTDHHRLVDPLGLDGVHISDPHLRLAPVRKALGPDRVLGAAGGTTRHTAMTLAEAGADYVSLGPVRAGGVLGDGHAAEDALFRWWAEMIETPVVAEGGVTPEDVARLADLADFFVPGPDVWEAAEPAAALAPYVAALG